MGESLLPVSQANRWPRFPGMDEPLDPTTKKGLIAAGIAVVIASVVWIVISNEKADMKAKQDAAAKLVSDFLGELERVEKEENASAETMTAAITLIDTQPNRWKGEVSEPHVLRIKAKLTARLDKKKAKGEFDAVFTAAKATVDAIAATPSEQLIATKQKLTDIEIGSEIWDPAYPAQIKEMKSKIDNVLVTKMRDEAKAFAAVSGSSPRQAIAKYAAAEDYVRKAVEDAKRANNKPDELAYTETFKSLLVEADEFYNKVMTPEFIETIPWKDLLGGDMASRWSKSTNVPGFACRVENGILTISPPDAGSKLQGVAAILDQQSDTLRNFVLEMEFSVEGIATMFFHVAPPPGSPDNRQSESFDLSSKDGGVKAGDKYQFRCRYVGSQIRIEFPDQDITPWEPNPSWSKRRKGGIAFLIPEGTRLRVTKMKIRELR